MAVSIPMQSALAHVGLHAALHFLAIWMALTILFKLKLSQLTHDAVQGEIEGALQKVLYGPTGALTATLRKHAASKCQTRLALQRAVRVIRVLGSGTGESATAVHNRAVVRESVTLGIIAPAVGAALLAALIATHRERAMLRCRRRGSSSSCRFEIPLAEIVGNLAVGMVVIAAYEGVFVMRVATKYVPVKASAIVETATRRGMQWLDKQQDPIPAPQSVADPVPQRAGLLAASCGTVAATAVLLAAVSRKADAIRGVPATLGVAISSSLCIGIAVTAVYFTKAKESEARQVERQVERNVDATMRRYDAISGALLCPSQIERMRDEARTALAKAMKDPPDMTEAQRAIDEHNLPLERFSQRMVAAAAAAAVLVVLAGGLTVTPGAVPLYAKTAVLSAVMGAAVSFTAEYGFMQGVMARFEASDPERSVNNVVKRLAASVDDDGAGDCPSPYCN